MTIRKILLYVALALIVLVAGRIIVIFLPPVAGLWFWRILVAPYILVGSLVALVLLLITVICHGKIRYRVNASIGDDKMANVEVSYLMRLVHFVLVYRDGELDNRVRIAWMKIGEEKPHKRKRKSKSAEAKDDVRKESDYANKDAGSISASKSKPPPDGDGSPEAGEKDRLKPLKQAKAILTYPDRKIIMSLCLRCLKKFVRALKPKYLDVYGVIGFDDPCTTGWAMGTYEAAAGIMQLRHKVRLYGNYQEKALELAIKAEGRTRVWSLIWPFIWLYLHKPIRKVVHEHLL